MNKARRQAIVLLAGAGLASAGAHYLKPTRHLADVLGKPDLEVIFPKTFGQWRVDEHTHVVQPSPETQALLDSIYNQTLTRTYMNEQGTRIMLSVAYGGDQSDATRAHLPEVCYPAQGFQILQNFAGHIELAGRTMPVRYLMSAQGTRSEPITYWLVVGDTVTVSRTDQKLAQFRLGLEGFIPDGMLVRVSSIDSNMQHGHAVQEQFLKELAAALTESARVRVLGRIR